MPSISSVGSRASRFLSRVSGLELFPIASGQQSQTIKKDKLDFRVCLFFEALVSVITKIFLFQLNTSFVTNNAKIVYSYCQSKNYIYDLIIIKMTETHTTEMY